ncbi:hypothetical protein POG06_16970, partial [Enterococcus innesii]|uniref:hypothetical protein n=1 Tax=Enterococcus innesii TaxID=2839759 RepID=UPI00233090C2
QGFISNKNNRFLAKVDGYFLSFFTVARIRKSSMAINVPEFIWNLLATSFDNKASLFFKHCIRF